MNDETMNGIQDETMSGAAVELGADALEQCRGGMDQQAQDALMEALRQDATQMQRFGGMHGGSAVERMAREAHAQDALVKAVSSAIANVTTRLFPFPVR